MSIDSLKNIVFYTVRSLYTFLSPTLIANNTQHRSLTTIQRVVFNIVHLQQF